MSNYKRIEALEEQLAHKPESSSGARERMKEHLDRIAYARHTGWSEEIEAEVEDVRARVRKRLDQGEGVR